MNVVAQVQDGITPSLNELAKQYPQFYRQALRDLGRKWRNTISKEMRAGAPAGQPFAPLSQLTQDIRAGKLQSLRKKRAALRAEGISGRSKRGQALTRQRSMLKGFGGKLPDLVEYDTADGVRVGFLAGVFGNTKPAAERWIRQSQRAWSRQERHWLHQLYGDNIPFMAYAKPERQAVAPQQVRWNQDAEQTIRKSLLARLQASQARNRA